MHRNWVAVILCMLLSFLSNAQGQDSLSSFEKGKVFAKFKESISIDQLRGDRADSFQLFIQTLKGKDFKILSTEWPFRADWRGLNRVLLLRVDLGQEDRLLEFLSENRQLEYTERLPAYKLFYKPNDIKPQQWNLDKINAENAWDITKGNSDVTVAIVDDAISLSHEDLAPVLWTNPGEIAGNGVDDDGNGYVDDVHGYDTGMNDPDPNPPSGASSTYFFHGTHTSGIAGAATDNNIGIASIGFGISIMAVKIADDNGSLVGAYAGVEYAIENGADVISMSWGGYVYSKTYELIFEKANDEGIVCIAAAGNDNTDTKAYPAAYNHVLAVGSTDGNDRKSGFSNYGSWVDVMAPGEGIYSTVPGSAPKYASYSGTSMSAPLVSGLAALIKSIDTSKTVEEITACILNTADDIAWNNPGYLGALGSGRINAWEAVKCAAYITADFSSDKRELCPGAQVSYRDESTNNPQSWEWHFPGGTPSSSTLQNPVVQYPFSGQYDVTLIASNSRGSDTLTRQQYITVGLPTATLSGNFSVLPGYPVNLRLDLTGNPPWEVTYTDGSQYYTLSNIMSSPFYFPVVVYDTTEFSLAFMKDNGCNGTVSGTARVNTINLINCEGGDEGVVRFNSSDNREVGTIIRTKDKGYVIAGVIYKINGTNTGLFIVKLDDKKNLIWEKEIFKNTNIEGRPIVVSEDNQGNLYVGGTESWNNNGGALLIKLSASGDILWEFVNGIASTRSTIRDILILNDTIYLGGTLASDGFGSSDGIIIKLDTFGGLIDYQLIGLSNNDHILDLISTQDGRIAGGHNTMSFNSGNRSGWMFSMNNDLSFDWNKIYFNSSLWLSFTDYIEVSDGFIAIGRAIKNRGQGDIDILIVKMDKDGKVIWSKSYGASNKDEYALKINKAINGGYYLTCYEAQSNNEQNAIVIYVDDSGNKIWARRYSLGSGNSMGKWSKPAVVNNSSHLILAVNHNGDLIIFNINPCGESKCYFEDVNITTQTLQVLYTDVIMQRQSVSNPRTFQLLTQSNPPIREVICESFDSCSIKGDFSFLTACPGDTIYFIDESYDSLGQTSITNWLWEFGDGSSISGIADPGHVYQQAGNYMVRLIVYGDSSTTCTDTIIKNVLISDSLQLAPLRNDTICLGDTIRLPKVHAFCGIPPYSYSWSPGVGLADSTKATPKASPEKSTTYTLTVYDSTGSTAQITYRLIVDSSCCVSFARFRVSDTSACVNEYLQFTDLSKTKGVVQYHWDFGSNADPANYQAKTPPLVRFFKEGSYRVLLWVEDDCGMDSTSQMIYINPLPYANVIEDTLICKGDTVQLGEFIADQSYQWTPNSYLENDKIGNPKAFPPSDIKYQVEIKDVFTGCTTIDSVEIMIKLKPLVNLPADTGICMGDTIWVKGVSNTDSIVWSTGATDIDSIQVTGGLIWIETANECGSSLDSMWVNIYPSPTVDAGPDTSVPQGTKAMLQGYSSAPIHRWLADTSGLLECDTCLETLTLPLDSSMYFYLMATDVNGCQAFDTVYIQVKLICSDIMVPNAFTPNGDGLNDEYRALSKGNNEEFILLEVYNRWGEQLFRSTEKSKGWDGRFRGKDQEPGVYTYLLRYRCEGEEFVVRGNFTLIR